MALLEDLGRRAALALDNARLYAERSAIAQTLQRALLPPHLPLIPGAQVAARYLAAGSGNEVGGDFYDCFSTGGDDWALVIGDVCGKGAEAAAITAIARYTLRASVLHSRRPRRVLEELNEALLRQGLDYRFCTVALRLGHAAGGRRGRRAGHGRPPAAARAARGRLGRDGGHAGNPAGRRCRTRRSPRRRVDAAPRRLAGALHGRRRGGGPVRARRSRPRRSPCSCAARRGATRREIAAAIERAALAVQDGRLRDDVAVVVLRIRPGGVEAPFDAAGAGVATPA